MYISKSSLETLWPPSDEGVQVHPLVALRSIRRPWCTTVNHSAQLLTASHIHVHLRVSYV